MTTTTSLRADDTMDGFKCSSKINITKSPFCLVNVNDETLKLVSKEAWGLNSKMEFAPSSV